MVRSHAFRNSWSLTEPLEKCNASFVQFRLFEEEPEPEQAAPLPPLSSREWLLFPLIAVCVRVGFLTVRAWCLSQLIKSIENIQRKSGEMSILFAKKSNKKIRKGEVQKIRVKNKKQEKKREFLWSRSRVCVFLFCVSRYACSWKFVRACACVCVYCVLREGFKLENRCDRM